MSVDIYREMWQVAMALLAERDRRIEQQARDLAAKVQETRDLTADMLRYCRRKEQA